MEQSTFQPSRYVRYPNTNLAFKNHFKVHIFSSSALSLCKNMNGCSFSTLMTCFNMLELSQKEHVTHDFSPALQAVFEFLPFHIDSLNLLCQVLAR